MWQEKPDSEGFWWVKTSDKQSKTKLYTDIVEIRQCSIYNQKK